MGLAAVLVKRVDPNDVLSVLSAHNLPAPRCNRSFLFHVQAGLSIEVFHHGGLVKACIFSLQDLALNIVERRFSDKVMLDESILFR